MAKKKKATPSRKQAKRQQKQKKAFPWWILGVAVVVAGGWFAWPYLQAVPDISQPLDAESLDPAVASLIEAKIEGIEADPRNATLRAELGMAYEANTLWKEARQSYENALALDDDNMAWNLHYAVATRESGDVEQSRILLEQIAMDYPSSAPVYHRLAEALEAEGAIEEAEQAYRRLIKLAPTLPQGYVGLADIMLQKGNNEGAVQMAEQALGLQSNNRRAFYVLGQAYQQLGRLDEAEEALAIGLNAGVEHVPDPLTRKVAEYIVNATGRISIAQSFLDSGNPQQAASVLEETFTYHPSNIMLLNTLAVSYMRTKRLDQAQRLLERARLLDDDQFYTYLNLYNWALRAGNNEQALAFADSAVHRAPERDDTHLARAQALTELNRLEEAAQSAADAVERGAQNAANYGLSGEIAFRRKQYAEAESFLTKATSMNPRMALAWVSLARTYREQGDMMKARQTQNQAREAAPNHPAVAQLLREF